MKRLLFVAMAFVIVAPLFAKPLRDSVRTNFHFVDFQSMTNQKLADSMHNGTEGNDLRGLPGGNQEFGGVQFKIGSSLLQLGSKVVEKMPEKIEGIKVDRLCNKLHVLHATGYGGGPNQPGNPGFVEDGTRIGDYRVTYEDKTTVLIPIVYGQDVRDWFFLEGERLPNLGKVVWTGDNAFAKEVGARLRLYLSSWDNPMPAKRVTSIDYLSRKDDTAAAPFCVAITVEGK
jgi:hypothetical protein